MRIRIAFYKGDGSWWNGVVKWWTKSQYSHAELVMPDEITWISISPFLTSRVESREKKEYDENSWDFIDFFISEKEYHEIEDFYEETKGSKYDWAGMLLSQILPVKYRIKNVNKWYCSEWIAHALRAADVIHWKKFKIYSHCDLSPGTLYKIVDNARQENL